MQRQHSAQDESKGSQDNASEGAGDQDDDYEDDDKDFEGELLKPNRYFLTFKKEQNHQARLFTQFMLEQQGSFQRKCMVVLLIAFLFQTLVIISVRTEFDLDYVIIPLRLIYCLFLLFLLLVPKWLLNRNLRAVSTFVLYMYGIIVVVGQAFLARDANFEAEVHTIQVMEIAFLYLIAVNCR